MVTVSSHNVGSMGNGDTYTMCNMTVCLRIDSLPVLFFLLSFFFILQSQFPSKQLPRMLYYKCCKLKFGGLNEGAWVNRIQFYSGISKHLWGCCIYIYTNLLSVDFEVFVIKPMPSCMASMFCIYNNLCLMIHNNVEAQRQHQLYYTASWVRNQECVVVQFWFKGLHDAVIKIAAESAVILKVCRAGGLASKGADSHHQKGGTGCWWKAIVFFSQGLLQAIQVSKQHGSGPTPY